jgi:hypothetical protein
VLVRRYLPDPRSATPTAPGVAKHGAAESPPAAHVEHTTHPLEPEPTC